jgi:hypothetical protein
MHLTEQGFKAGNVDIIVVGENYKLDVHCILLRSPPMAPSAQIVDGQLTACGVGSAGVYKIRRHPHEDPMKIVAYPKATLDALAPVSGPHGAEGLMLALARGVSTDMLDALTELHPLPPVNLEAFGAASPTAIRARPRAGDPNKSRKAEADATPAQRNAEVIR